MKRLLGIVAVLWASLCSAAPTDDAARLLVYEQHALTHEGNVARGQELFRDAKRTRCIACHRVSEQGGAVGPDLSQIGGKFDRPHLIESLLAPSRQIVEGFRSSVVALRDGRIEIGIVREQSEQCITLVDAAGQRHERSRGEIDEQFDSPTSLMPQLALETLEPAEFTNLIAYLETLRPGGKPKPGAGITGPIKLPPGFTLHTIATGLTGTTALETTADGRILVCEQTGTLRVVQDGKLLDEPLLTLPVDSRWERGLIGVTVHPKFPATPYIYVCYVAKTPFPRHVVSRFTMAGNRAEPGSEKILLEGDDQTNSGGKVPAGHQGGALHFGLDDKLYIAIGEHTAETPAQRLDSLLGKILRINPDGSIPADNPLLAQTTGKYQAIWAFGLRNPYTFAIRRTTGEMFINDVGGKFEDINRGLAGANYGWPIVEHGPTADSRFQGPVYSYPQASAIGADFSADASIWPPAWRGRYFFADYVHGWITTLNPAHPEQAVTFATGLRRPSDLRFAPDGSLYVLLRNAWVIDDKFQPRTGTLLAIRYVGDETTLGQ